MTSTLVCLFWLTSSINSTALGENCKINGDLFCCVSGCCCSHNCLFPPVYCFPAAMCGSSWVVYQEPNYRGQHYILEKKDYNNFSDWGAQNSTVGSMRRIRFSWAPDSGQALPMPPRHPKMKLPPSQTLFINDKYILEHNKHRPTREAILIINK